jgi:hypothetical protein
MSTSDPNFKTRTAENVLHVRVVLPRPADTESFSIAGKLGGFLSLLAISVYFAGWLYGYFLYNEFGIPLRYLDPPLYYVLIYAYEVYTHSFITIIVTLLFIAALAVCYFRRGLRFAGLTMAILMVLSFPLTRLASHIAAMSTANAMREGKVIRSARITFSDSLLTKDAPILADTTGQLRLLTQTSDEYMLLYQPASSIGKVKSSASVFVIQKERIASLRLTVN